MRWDSRRFSTLNSSRYQKNYHDFELVGGLAGYGHHVEAVKRSALDGAVGGECLVWCAAVPVVPTRYVSSTQTQGKTFCRIATRM